MKLIRVDNPFRPADGNTEVEFASRKEMLAYIAEHKLSSEQYTLSLNGELLPPEKLDGLAVHKDDCLVVMPVLGNKTLQSIATIGVIIAAAFLAAPVAGFLFGGSFGAALGLGEGAATQLTFALLAIGGTLLVNWVASFFQKQQSGASYTFDGPQTVARSGIPIPKGYGIFMAAPNIVQSWVDLQRADQDWHDDPNGSLDTGRQWLNIIACFGFGPAVSLSDIRINGNDIASYTDVAYFVQLGTNTQGTVTASDPGWTILNQTTTGNAPNTNPTTDFDRIVNSYPQSQRIRCDVTKNWVAVTGTRNDTQRLDVTVQFPRGVWRYDSNMQIQRLDVEYKVYYKLTTDTSWTLASHHFYSNIRQGILRQLTTIDNLPAGQYDVKVEKIGVGGHNDTMYAVEHESDYFGDELWLESVQETCYDALAYPNMILLGLRIMASDQIAGANIQVTAKVEYDTRVSLPTELAGYAHSNPALVAYDVLTDPLVGGGLSPNDINLPGFVEWADLCDTTVDAGNGSMVKLAEFNGLFEEASKTVWDSFSSIGVMSRATPTRIGTQVGVMLDKADDPVQVFNVGNIFKDSYSKDYLATEDRANEVEVNYANADDDYKTRNPVRCIPIEDLDSGYAIKKTKINLLGCTSTVQAYYWGTHRLLENQLLLRTHKWDSPVQAIVSRIGNVVMLQHDVPQWAQGGLIVGGTASAPILDAPYTYASGQTLTVTYPILKRVTGNITAISGNVVTVDGYAGDPVKRLVSCHVDVRVLSYTSTTVTVESASGLAVGISVDLYDLDVIAQVSVSGITVDADGYFSTLTLASDLPADPIVDSPYILAQTSSQPKLVRIRGIKRNGEQKFSITAIDYDPAVYDIPVPGTDDLLALTSGVPAGYTGGSASTANPVTPTPANPPTSVISPGSPGYLGSSVPSALSSYSLSPLSPLSQTNATTIVLASVTVTYADGSAATFSHTFTISDPGSTPVWYYITTNGTGTYYCETATTKVGDPSYTYLGSILATHSAGAHSAPMPGGWPIPANVEAAN